MDQPSHLSNAIVADRFAPCPAHCASSRANPLADPMKHTYLSGSPAPRAVVAGGNAQGGSLSLSFVACTSYAARASFDARAVYRDDRDETAGTRLAAPIPARVFSSPRGRRCHPGVAPIRPEMRP